LHVIIIHVIVNGGCFGWNFKTAKCENSIMMCVFIGSPPYDNKLMSLEVWETRDEIHSFIHSFTSSLFFFNI
jgi:hypothetical protein